MAKITIFGLAGTGTSSVGKAVAEKLGYTYLSTGNIFRKKAEEMGLDLYQYDALCDTDPEYDKQLDKEIEVFGSTHDNIIVEARLAWYFIPDSYKIKFVCDLDTRIQRVSHRDGIPFEEAKEKTLLREAAGRKRYAINYGMTEFAPDNAFDLIIDTTSTPIDQIVAQILTKIGK